MYKRQNQGWTAKEAIRIITAMEDKGLNIDLVEQPVPAHDLDDMRAVTDVYKRQWKSC